MIQLCGYRKKKRQYLYCTHDCSTKIESNIKNFICNNSQVCLIIHIFSCKTKVVEIFLLLLCLHSYVWSTFLTYIRMYVWNFKKFVWILSTSKERYNKLIVCIYNIRTGLYFYYYYNIFLIVIIFIIHTTLYIFMARAQHHHNKAISASEW